MKNEISIVIPVYQEGLNIRRTVASLENLVRRTHAEIIIVDGDGGSTIQHLGKIENIKMLVSQAGRAQQMNMGAQYATSKYLLFLHADSILPPTAIVLVLEALQSYAAGAFALKIDSSHIFLQAIAAIATLRSIITSIPFGDQGQFFRRSVFEKIGGYPTVPLMEDIMIMKKLRTKHVPIITLWPRIHTSARRWRNEGIVQCTARNWLVQLLFAYGISTDYLKKCYPVHTKKDQL